MATSSETSRGTAGAPADAAAPSGTRSPTAPAAPAPGTWRRSPRRQPADAVAGLPPVTVALVGAGNRGQTYLSWAREHPGRARLVAVADPQRHRRDLVAAGDPGVAHYADWRDLAAQGRVADMVVIATQDRDHAEPAEAFAALGYAVLLEKPIAPTEADCRRIVAAIERAGVLFGVCHVLRYTPYTDLVKEVVDSGVLGRVVDVQHLEPVGWWHMAHSYVRGPWRREDESAPMLLAKSCHDVDWIRYVTGLRVESVSSFGSLTEFRPENRPAGAADRCLDCALEPTCPYSAPRLYLGTLRADGPVWPVTVVTPRTDEQGVVDALRTGPYGRCVWDCDNDVVDHQVVAMRLEGGAAATFTMTAFSEQTHRQTRVFGTHGSLEGDGERVRVVDFRDNTVRVLDTGTAGSNAADGHGGGDAGLMDAFTAAVATGDRTWVRSGAAESLDSHLVVFAAEQARRTGQVREVGAA
ncbi:Gfo/Idh/MocA family protein [Cellulosimicrobium cellulans]|uniref:Gfo/Idh/MocA family protein n=1 Tax=Cellulosimicrobium cellulans TaxID=1710 RepID=UPI00130E2923|nr:Gfo/Idh/MocA family oxidoreductase [Cellulosimicrobium cellulans]